MDLSKLGLFSMARERMAHSGQRQAVLAQNIANANTPNYRAKDLAELDFSKKVHRHVGVQLANTAGQHLTGTRSAPEFRVDHEDRNSLYEINPDKNQVVLEEQMLKVSENQMRYQLASNIYQKNISMFRMALRGQQS